MTPSIETTKAAEVKRPKRVRGNRPSQLDIPETREAPVPSCPPERLRIHLEVNFNGLWVDEELY